MYNRVKWFLSLLASCALALNAPPAMAAKSAANQATVLQGCADRAITPQAPLARHPVVDGESPTTGLALAQGRYMPMLVEISSAEGTVKVGNKKVKASGVGARAPWGAAYADILYESLLWGRGQTRITLLLSDSFALGQPTSVGPVRSIRLGAVLLRDEWQGGIVFTGGPSRGGHNVYEALESSGAAAKGLVFGFIRGDRTHFNRISGVKAPDNLNANPAAMRAQIPDSVAAVPRPFLFADESPYGANYAPARRIDLDWGAKASRSHFVYDEASGLYQRCSGDAPYLSFASAQERGEDQREPLTFRNVIVQRVRYTYTDNNTVLPVLHGIGRGNADLFLGGRYIPGYWVRASAEEPTVFLDDCGNEVRLARGKTFIAQFPPEALLSYQAEQ